MSKLIAEAITEYLGERCADFDADCLSCKTWAEYDALSQARAEGRREGLEAGAAAASDLAQQWDDGEGSRTFNACMAIQDKLLEMAKEGGGNG